MRRTIAIIAAILTVPLWTSGPAGAQFDVCITPDEAPPIFESQNFTVEPTVFGYDLQDVRDQGSGSIGVPQPDANQFGLKIRQVADDRQHHFEDPNYPNYVVAAWLEVDGGAIERTMLPEDGRWGSIKEPIFTVLEPFELEYGTHVIAVSARDSCGNVGTFTRWVLHVPPAVTIICEGYMTTACDA